MNTDRKDGRVLGIIFLVVGLSVLAIALWQKFVNGEGSNLFAAAATISAAGVIILNQSKRSGDDAR